jgi:uncharacterized protein involved in exopolysaccharide biosynthesis
MFDAFEYIDYLLRQWRVVAIAVVASLVLSLAASLLIPKRYTATAIIVIEPPGASDPRNTTTVSPMYLESLKTYERFATSDSLFARAAERFQLLHSGGSVESLKRRVLKVSKIRDTKILEISASLPDPKVAQSLAQYVAEETASLSKGASMAADREFVDEAEKQSAEARLRLDKAQNAWNILAVSGPLEALKSEIDSSVELQSALRQQLIDAEANVAEYQQQTDGQFAKEQLQSAKARAGLLEKRTQELARSIQEKSILLATRIAKRDELQTELRIAQSSYETISARLRDLRAGAGMHSERLRVIDPGIVPQRPSSPNVFLNVSVAVFLALIASITWLSLAFAYRRRPVGFEPEVARSRRG